MNPISVNGPFVALAETVHFSYGRFRTENLADASKSLPSPLWGHCLPVTALALSARRLDNLVEIWMKLWIISLSWPFLLCWNGYHSLLEIWMNRDLDEKKNYSSYLFIYFETHDRWCAICVLVPETLEKSSLRFRWKYLSVELTLDIWVNFLRTGKMVKMWLFFWTSAVTKRFDFFNFSQLFWRDFAWGILKICLKSFNFLI